MPCEGNNTPNNQIERSSCAIDVATGGAITAMAFKLAKNERRMIEIHLALRKIHITAVDPLMTAAGARAIVTASRRAAAIRGPVAVRAPESKSASRLGCVVTNLTRRPEAQPGLTCRETDMHGVPLTFRINRAG